MAPRRYFFRATDGSLIGPVNLNSVAEMIRASKVKANTPISLDGENFSPMKSLPELATLLSVDVDLPDSGLGDDILDSPPTYSGDLTQVSIPKLFYHFTASKANGRLLLSNQAVRKELFLVNGKPVAARSNLERDLLSKHLERNGVIPPQQMQALIGQLGGNEDRLGDLLIQRRLIQPHLLFEQLKQQLLEKIHEVFGWRIGTYAFYDGQEYKGTLLPLNLNPWEVVADGVRMGYELSELRALLEPLRNRILLPRENQHVHVTKLVLHPRELKVFKTISAGRTLGGILERLGGGEDEDRMVLAMIYMGLEMELIGIGDQIVTEPIHEMGTETTGDEWDHMFGEAFTGSSPPAEDAPSAPPGQIQARPTTSRQEQNLLEQLNDLKAKNFFDRLELATASTSKDASKAFMQVARAYHPDQVPQEASPRVRELTSDIFSLYNEAHQTLSDDRKRAEYAEAIEAGFEDGQVDISNIMESEALFQKGEALANNGRFPEAAGLFQKAIDLNPDEGEFFIYRGYANFFAASNPDSLTRERCLQDIKKGLQMRDNNVANGFLFLGRIYKALGDMDSAVKNFKKTLSLEKNNLEASRELRLLSMRTKKKGLFKKS